VAVATAALAPAWRARANGPASAEFTKAQADQGADLYSANCASCHGPGLNDGMFAPSLKGRSFRGEWGDKSVGQLYAYASANMPPGQAGVLAPEDYVDVIAFLMQANGAQPGAKPLPADPQALSALAWPG
jgi:mono/diheme cytochrome c family protein